MPYNAPRTPPGRTLSGLLPVAVVVSLLVAGLLVAYRTTMPSSTSSPRSSPGSTVYVDAPASGPPRASSRSGPGIGAVTGLDPDLLSALREATADAADDGVRIRVTSGWRSAAHQARLLQEAIEKYGSEEEAARWVATPESSPHVSGDAIDVGGSEAMDWLSEHGADHGLCQIYDNEPWHYELRPEAEDDGCPATYADAASDPRMQR